MIFSKFKKEPKFKEEALLNPLISNQLINEVIIDGDFINLEILSQNEKLKNINPELIMSMSKITEIVWFKQIKNQLAINLFVLILGLFIFKFYNWINAFLMLNFLYLYFIKQKKINKIEKQNELIRQKYILDILEKTELKHLSLEINFEASHTHKP
jgi:hypothetical protein